jgi:membrane-associated phospholipid phosphatase
VDLPECGDCYLHDLLELRNGDLPSIDVTVMTGVIAFPSFHAVFAMMFTYAHRSSVTFPVVAVLNLLMLFSIPSEGGHYLVDVIGGLMIGGVTIGAARLLASRAPPLAPATPA